MTKQKMTTAKRDALVIALLSVLSLASLTANVVLRVPFSIISIPLIGIIAYCAYIRLGDYDIHIVCDYIQTGEAPVGSFALFAFLMLVSDNPYLALLIVFTSLLAYELFLRAAIAPDMKEQAVAGAVAQAILFVIVAFILAAGPGLRIHDPRAILFGYSTSLGISLIAPAALLLAVLLLIFPRAFKPELRLFSLGPAFFKAGTLIRMGLSAAVMIARSILLAITIFLAGWICGFGISIHRLYRGRQADAITLLSLICFWQIITLLAELAGPWFAAALMYVASYALFVPYFNKRVFLYDRYQQS